MRTLATLALLGTFVHAAAAPLAQDPAGMDEVVVAAKVQQVPVTKGLAVRGAIRSARAAAITLAPPAADLAAHLRRPSKGAPLHLGVQRAVPGLDTEAGTASALSWQRMADGSLVAAVTVTSPSAHSVRVALRVAQLPDDAIVRFEGVADGSLFEVRAAEIGESIARNVQAGDDSPQSRLYWSPLLEGDSVVVEVQLPAGANPSQAAFSVPELSHLVTSAAKNFELPTKSASCEVDAMCSASQWGAQMNAVARMVFTDSTGTYLCTGTLLADQDTSSQIPYFLTANHCISTQAAASTLTTFWFYRSSACNSTAVGPYQQLTGGATLLYATTATDTSFMRLANTPPTGTVFAGWAIGAQASGTAVTGLHHPGGDWLKISNGSVAGTLSCTPPTNGQFSCSSATSGAGFYDVHWTSGITEPGSSGSGLFRADGSLVGQLYGGSGTCITPGDDVYGRFDQAYPSLSRWLTGQPLTVARSGTGSGSVTSNPAAISCGSTCTAALATGTTVTLTAAPASGSSFSGWSGACTGTGNCTVTLNSPQSVVASFDASGPPLTVSVTGGGGVTSQPAGINCGTVCTAAFASGSSVTLTATPWSGMAFAGWGGACSGTGACVLSLSAPTSVSALFAAKSGSTITVATSASPSPSGQALTLTATVGGGSAAATGTVAFTSDGGFIAGCSSQPLDPTGTATCSTATLSGGTHSIVATYSGDGIYDASTSAPISQAISVNGAVPSGTLLGLSTRMQVLTGNEVLIGGFVVTGASPKTVVVRARGPSLAASGITGVLADPMLTLVPAVGGTSMTNDDWASGTNAAALQASGFAPSSPKESALLVTLDPGAYTVIVSGVGNTIGTALVEVYEVDHPEVPLTGISTRGSVQGGSNVMIAGFVIQGSSPQTVLLRARGPSLAAQGVTGALPNPTMQLYSGSTVIASNDDWGTASNAAQIAASGFAPSDPRESAILITLNPGAYTAVVTGVGGATGVGIAEVYAQ